MCSANTWSPAPEADCEAMGSRRTIRAGTVLDWKRPLGQAGRLRREVVIPFLYPVSCMLPSPVFRCQAGWPGAARASSFCKLAVGLENRPGDADLKICAKVRARAWAFYNPLIVLALRVAPAVGRRRDDAVYWNVRHPCSQCARPVRFAKFPGGDTFNGYFPL